MTRPPNSKNREKHPHTGGRNRNALFDAAHLRREFIADIRRMKKPINVMDITDRHDRCGLYPTCKHPAVERRIYWDPLHEYTIVDLCAEELKLLATP